MFLLHIYVYLSLHRRDCSVIPRWIKRKKSREISFFLIHLFLRNFLGHHFLIYRMKELQWMIKCSDFQSGIQGFHRGLQALRSDCCHPIPPLPQGLHAINSALRFPVIWPHGSWHAKDEIYDAVVSTMCDKWPQTMRPTTKRAAEARMTKRFTWGKRIWLQLWAWWILHDTIWQ